MDLVLLGVQETRGVGLPDSLFSPLPLGVLESSGPVKGAAIHRIIQTRNPSFLPRWSRLVLVAKMCVSVHRPPSLPPVSSNHKFFEAPVAT